VHIFSLAYGSGTRKEVTLEAKEKTPNIPTENIPLANDEGEGEVVCDVSSGERRTCNQREKKRED